MRGCALTTAAKQPTSKKANLKDKVPMQISAGGRKTFDSDRVITFSDGVIAVAITLLVLDLKLPEGVTDAQLPGVLSNSLHSFFRLRAELRGDRPVVDGPS